MILDLVPVFLTVILYHSSGFSVILDLIPVVLQ